MARPASFNKRDNEKKKLSKRLEKQKKKEERKNAPKGSFEDMIAYVDENGMIIDTPPETEQKEEINVEDIMISIPKKEEDTEPSLYRGRVEYLDTTKGFGFIKNLSSTDKYFFHVSNCPENIKVDNIVLFELERGVKGMNAVKITIDK